MYWVKDMTETLKFLGYVQMHKPIIVFDLETTGLKKQTDRIVQFSANKYEVVGKVYEMTDSIDLYIKPPFLMDASVIEVHGITNEFLENKLTEEECFKQILDFMDTDAVISGYNIKKFDVPFLNEMYKRNGILEFNPAHIVDIYQVAKENIYPRSLPEKSLKLCYVTKHYGLDDGISFHSASEDIMATWKCGVALLKEYVTNHTVKEEDKETVTIHSMSRYKKLPYVDRVYVEVFGSFGEGKLYYDIKTKGWYCEDDLIGKVNMEELSDKAEMISKSYGFKKLDKFENTYVSANRRTMVNV